MDKYSNSVLKLQILNDTRIFYYKSQKLQHKLCQKRISHPQEPQNPDQPEQPQGHMQKWGMKIRDTRWMPEGVQWARKMQRNRLLQMLQKTIHMKPV